MFDYKVDYVSSSYLTSSKPVEEETSVDNTNNGTSESDEVNNNSLSPTEKIAIEAGYYNVVASPTNPRSYCVLLKDDSRDEEEKGRKLLDEYLEDLGYESCGYYGGWISYDNNQYIMFCRDVKEKTEMDKAFDDIFG